MMRNLNTAKKRVSAKNTRLRLPALLTTLCCATFLFSTGLFAQTFPPASSCTSKDLELISATLPPPANDPCQCSGTRTLVLGIRNKTGSTRTSFALWGTLVRYNSSGVETSRTPIFACAGPIQKNSDNFLPATSGMTTITVSCGESLEIVDLYLAWTSASGNETCAVLQGSPSTINPKCGTLGKIAVGTGVNANVTVTNATCSAQGSLKVFPTGGTAPYKVKIGTDERTGIPAGGSATFSLDAGSYNIVITDNRPCSTTISRTIGSTTPPSVSGIGGDFTKTCNQNTAGATIGETPVNGFTYSWAPSAGLSDAAIGNPTANPSSTTTYTVTKRETATGCTATKAVVVTVNTTPPSVSGIGGAFTKTCTANTNGATIGETPVSGFTYAWLPTTGLSDASIGNPTANPSATTTYTVTKTSTANGCSATKAVVVTVDQAAPTANAGSAFTKTCTAFTSGKQIGVAPEVGFTYSWLPTTGLSDASIANPTANPSSTTTYTVTKTNTANGCFDTDDVTVTVDQAAPTAHAGDDFTKTCISNASGKQIGAAPEAGFTYSWSPTTGLSNAAIANPTANPSSTITYTVTKTSTANGCFDTDDVTVTVNTDKPQFTVCVVQPSLCGNTGSVTFNATGGSGFQYSIDGGSNYQAGNSFTGLGSNSVSGLKVKNDFGCVSDATDCENIVSDCSQQDLAARTARSIKSGTEASLSQSPSVKAYPNPFGDRINFVVTSPVSGRGSLEVFNALGQRVKTVFQGNVVKGAQSYSLQLPIRQQANLIYVLRVGDKQVSGKILQLNQ
jgi:hypothetical protein